MCIVLREPFSGVSWSQKRRMSKKQSLWEDFLEFSAIAALLTYFIIANAFLGASREWWAYDHAEIFSWGMFIVLGVVVAYKALDLGIEYLHRRLNPPPPPPAKKPLPNHRTSGKRTSLPQSSSFRKTKNGQVSYAEPDYPTSDLPF